LRALAAHSLLQHTQVGLYGILAGIRNKTAFFDFSSKSKALLVDGYTGVVVVCKLHRRQREKTQERACVRQRVLRRRLFCKGAKFESAHFGAFSPFHRIGD